MFLFKNTKSLAKRIIMNIAVFGWIGIFVTMLLAIILPDNFSEIIRYFLFISSFSALIGTVASIVWSIVEFFVNILSGNTRSKPTSTKTVYPSAFAKTESKVFTCSKCGESLPLKYLHSNGICASCANELNIQTVKPVKSSYLDIKLGEKFDGGFTEYYIYLRKDIKGYYIHESSWHYNAGTETHISTKYLDDSQIKSFSFDIFIRFIKAQYPEYEIDDEYLKDNIDLLRVFKKEKICQSGLDEHYLR